jgi:hypothetical protein
MGLPDSFDPLMDIGSAKNVGDNSTPAIPGITGTSPLPQQFDSTANFGTNGHDVVFGLPHEGAYSGPQRQPADVDRFDGSGGL